MTCTSDLELASSSVDNNVLSIIFQVRESGRNNISGFYNYGRETLPCVKCHGQVNLRETRFLKIFLTLTFTYGQYVDVLVRNQYHSFGLAEGFLNSHWT